MFSQYRWLNLSVMNMRRYESLQVEFKCHRKPLFPQSQTSANKTDVTSLNLFWFSLLLCFVLGLCWSITGVLRRRNETGRKGREEDDGLAVGFVSLCPSGHRLCSNMTRNKSLLTEDEGWMRGGGGEMGDEDKKEHEDREVKEQDGE